jgi:indole-3-glycerol phosphate synthase/phosphoribosylanthranilate isomerase
VPDILDTIIERRKGDLEALGPTFGLDLPAQRERPVMPFLQDRGVILEIKRASPSKGAIAPHLDVPSLCRQYRAAGARAVSVLTEPHFFKGSLLDLVSATRSDASLAFLRKDFLLSVDEIDVSYRCGADAVLLIARILKLDLLMAMAARAHELGLRSLVEVRTDEDMEKLRAVSKIYPVLAGVNARDLATFAIDPLIPALMIGRLPIQAVYESGIQGPAMARYAAELGYQGILVGEGAAKHPETAADLVSAFLAPGMTREASRTGFFWRSLAERREEKRHTGRSAETQEGPACGMPLVKICGLTRTEDAIKTAELGADILGFVFAESKRTAQASVVREIRKSLDPASESQGRRPLLVGVINKIESPLAAEALALCREGVLDAIQWHGDPLLVHPSLEPLPHYRVVPVASSEDMALVRRLLSAGSVRLLLDTKVEGQSGGTGTMIRADLLDELRREIPDIASQLWIAGGLGPDTVGPLVKTYRPELVDASSRLEAEPGKKDWKKLEAFFAEITASA